MSRNPQAVLDVLEFYSENLAPRPEEPKLTRAETDPAPLNRIDVRNRPPVKMAGSQSIMDLRVFWTNQAIQDNLPVVQTLPTPQRPLPPTPAVQKAAPRKKPPKDPRLSNLSQNQIMEKLRIKY